MNDATTINHRTIAPRVDSAQNNGIYFVFFILYAIFAVYFYHSVIEPYLASKDYYGPRLLADAITYESICTIEREYADLATLRDIGPCLGLWIFDYNSGLLSFVDAALIVGSTIWLSRVYQRPWKPLLALVLINPITFASLFAANKEVYGFVSFATLVIFIKNRSLLALVLCLITALFTRLPALATTMLYCMLLITALPRDGLLSLMQIRRYYSLIAGMILVASAISAVYGAQLQLNLLGDFSRAEDISRSTELSLSLNVISDYGIYAIVYIARVLLNLYSGISGLTNLARGDGANYYTIGVVGSSTIFIILSIRIFRRGLPSDLAATAIGWNILFFMIFVTVFLCLSPVIQHRYFFPLYVMLVLFSFKKETRHEA